MIAETLKSWRVVFLIERANPRFRPLPFTLTVQAATPEEAKAKAQGQLDRFRADATGFSRGDWQCTIPASVGCFVTEARS